MRRLEACAPEGLPEVTAGDDPAELVLPALAGGADGMDFIRDLFLTVAAQMNENAVLVLEIGHERAHFERAFPRLEPLWLETSSGSDQVLLLTRQQLA